MTSIQNKVVENRLKQLKKCTTKVKNTTIKWED